ncbi:unnamed protein product [Darwinula stevensoni]|uniref:Uncharacterized protein n=1 Tax=Darwinula stevensoni TaxID=69355 RepID=A0A7R8XG48_9CRUS|nr:unnamed protein product [Darwinula stevensoni]CAG0892242.1 unnamed protein product [Darwinula stevensoni]
MELRGKVVWITGAGSGIGRQLAVSLAQIGSKLVLHSLQGEDLDYVKALCLENAQGRLSEEDILILYGDIAEMESHEKWVRHVLQHFKTVDILINNAGMNIFQKAYETPLDLTRRLFDVNFFGMNIFQKAYETPLDLTRRLFDVNFFGNVGLAMALLPHFRQRKAGHIVVTSSVLSFFSGPNASSYCASKRAVQVNELSLERLLDALSSDMMVPRLYAVLQRLRGKVVWITGAGSGIGRQLAVSLAQIGSKLVLHSLQGEDLDSVKALCLENARGRLSEEDILILYGDVAKVELHEEWVRHVLQHFEKVDILINNAGMNIFQKAYETPLDLTRRLFDVNFFGNVGLAMALLPHFRQRKAGHIVVTSSVLSFFSGPNASSYCASKRAVQGFYDALLAEEVGNGIKITTLQPGYVNTNIFANSINLKGESMDMGVFEPFKMDVASLVDWALVAIANNVFSACIAKKWIIISLVYYFPNLCKWIAVRIGERASNAVTKKK